MAGEISDNLKSILEYYGLEGEFAGAVSFGNGHINDTLCLKYYVNEVENKYVLQKINTSIFHNPEALMENMVRVTSFLRDKISERGGDPERETLNVVRTADGSSFCRDGEGGFWRMTRFIEGAVSIDTASCPDDMYFTGKAFGAFQRDLSDFPADTLTETLPGFHDTRARYAGFLKAVEADRAGRARDCASEIEFITGRKHLAEFSMDSFDRGELPLRVTHNDTKINNLLIDAGTHEALCVIDLDTVQPGFIMNDFGDAIRSGACTTAEDEPDTDKVKLSLEYYEAFTKGFTEGCGEYLTRHELETLPMGAVCITYEQALRFLEDYLNGDTYYKTAFPEHNRIRAHTQIKMVEEMEKHWDDLLKITEKYINKYR